MVQTSGSDVVVLAARRPVAVAIQAVLHDWIVQGLVNPVRVIDLDLLRDDRPELPVTVLEEADSRTAALQQDLARGKVRRVRLAMLNVVDEPETTIPEHAASRVLNAIWQSVPGAPCVQLNLNAGSPGGEWSKSSSVLLGWHNLAISPEESVAPAQGAAPLSRSTTDPRWLLQLVGTVCSLTALWPGQESSRFDDLPIPSGALLIPVRAFSRSLSSVAVQDALGQRLIEVRDRYPAPRVETGYATAIDDERGAAISMAEQLFQAHPDVMPRARKSTPPPPQEGIGAWGAVRKFLAFAGSALARAPRYALEAIDRSVSQTTANLVQNAVFGGADSGYAVVVRGVKADGSSTTWSEYEQSLDSVVRRTSNGELAPVPQKPKLWDDFIAGGFTLLDAGTRDPTLPPFSWGSQLAVISTTDRVAADPDGTFVLPANLAAFLPNWEIQAGDDIAVGRLLERLAHLATTQPHLGQTVNAERNRLLAWAENIRASYVGHVGRRLGDAHRGTIEDVEQLTKKVEELSGQTVDTESLRDEQEQFASNVRVMTGVGLSLIAIFAALSALAVLWWPFLLLAIVATVIGWVATGAAWHVKLSAKEHAVLNRMRATTTELEDAQRNRSEALEDLRRISRAYRQYLDWARIFGAFIHAPLGNAVSSAQRELQVGAGLPMNVAIGVAIPDVEAVEEVANVWRGELFRVGWLSGAWQEFLADQPAALGNLRHLLQSDVNLLKNDPAIDGVPVLSTWSTVMAANVATRGMSPAIEGRVVQLNKSSTQARDRLLGRVSVRDGQGKIQELSRSAFLDGLDLDVSHGSFLPGMFNPNAAVVDVRQVKDTVRQQVTSGLDDALVVIQTGGGYDRSAFAGNAARSSSPTLLTPDSDDFI